MLTRREKQVMELRKKGLKQSEIASKLKISQPAVSAFLNNALDKLNEAKKVIEFADKLGVEYKKE